MIVVWCDIIFQNFETLKIYCNPSIYEFKFSNISAQLPKSLTNILNFKIFLNSVIFPLHFSHNTNSFRPIYKQLSKRNIIQSKKISSTKPSNESNNRNFWFCTLRSTVSRESRSIFLLENSDAISKRNETILSKRISRLLSSFERAAETS